MRTRPLVYAVRAALVAGGVALWFWTQSLIGARPLPTDGSIGDGLFDVTAAAHQYLLDNPACADALLIASSLTIDILASGLIVWSLVGPSIRPFMGLLILFLLRQVCQGLCALPAPDGMIWRDPGFPSFWVTYEVANDFFFSGHTALAVYGAVELARLGRTRRMRAWLAGVAAAIVVFESTVVIVLRAHWTMDVFAGAVAALYVAGLAAWLAPACDRAIGRVGFNPHNPHSPTEK